MSSAGSVLSMIITLKNNARPKRKAFDMWQKKEHKIAYGAFRDKKISKTELEDVKAKIREKIKLQKRKRVFRLLIALFLMSAPIYALLNRAVVDIKLSNTQATTKNTVAMSKQEKMNELMENGKAHMNVGSYRRAVGYYKEGIKLYPLSKRANIGLLYASTYTCIKYGENCKLSKEMKNMLSANDNLITEMSQYTMDVLQFKIDIVVG